MCTACKLDMEVQSAFADRLVGILNNGALALMVSLGHRSGLFDTMRGMDPSTSEQIASRAGLNERYVREWLGAMTTGRIVECDAEGKRFRLPDEHAAILTRSTPTDNIAVVAQYIALLGSVEDRILECFNKGGGVPYSEFGRFHEVMAEDSGQTVLSALEEHVLPLIPGIADRLKQGIEVLDIGCGRGRVLIKMAAMFPNSRFTGYDLSEEPLAWARNEAARQGLRNITFERRDLTSFNNDAPPGRFDFITSFDAIHYQARPDNVLSGIHRALKPGGVYLMQDIKAATNVADNMEHPLASLIYTISCMHCMTVSLAQGGMGLGAAWGRQKAAEMLRASGFTQTNVHELSHDILNDYYVSRKAA